MIKVSGVKKITSWRRAFKDGNINFHRCLPLPCSRCKHGVCVFRCVCVCLCVMMSSRYTSFNVSLRFFYLIKAEHKSLPSYFVLKLFFVICRAHKSACGCACVCAGVWMCKHWRVCAYWVHAAATAIRRIITRNTLMNRTTFVLRIDAIRDF